MFNYQQMETLANERHHRQVVEAEQRRLEKLAPPHPSLLRAWVGQQLIKWGQRLQQAEQAPILTAVPDGVTS